MDKKKRNNHSYVIETDDPVEEMDDIDYLVYIMKNTLEGNFKLELGFVGDIPYQWAGYKKEKGEWKRGAVINHFVGFQTYIKPNEKQRKKYRIKT